MRAWREGRWAMLAACWLGCSGGSDPVVTAGGYGESPGPGQPPGFTGGDETRTTTSVSTLEALCLDACANVNAAGCDAQTFGCEGQCHELAAAEPGQCADEAAAMYACIAEASVGCTNDVPTYSSCDDESKKHQECLTPGSTGNCMRLPEGDANCTGSGLPPEFWQCADGVPPAVGCAPLGGTAFCCP